MEEITETHAEKHVLIREAVKRIAENKKSQLEVLQVDSFSWDTF